MCYRCVIDVLFYNVCFIGEQIHHNILQAVQSDPKSPDANKEALVQKIAKQQSLVLYLKVRLTSLHNH